MKTSKEKKNDANKKTKFLKEKMQKKEMKNKKGNITNEDYNCARKRQISRSGDLKKVITIKEKYKTPITEMIK